jgi:L-ascorbate metabolism protein UlaG (beta-lactamase superfamily)
MHDRFYLRDDTKLEPLVARWHAHPLLVSPPAAAFMTRHHLEIMASFVARPDLHRKALERPELRAGPFVASRSPGDVDEMRRLLDDTRASHADLLELAEQLDALVQLLRAADGFSLDPLYGRLGPRLDGRIELAYESSGRARFRLLEPLFYAAHPPGGREELALARVDSDDRPFVMSTPRLDTTDELFLPLAFDSAPAMALCGARERPVSRAQIDDWVGAQRSTRPRSRDQVEALFTREPPPPPRRAATSGRHLQYVGHACVQVATGREHLLIDPLLGYRFPGQSPRFTLRDLPETIDAAIVTHGHRDHYVLETLLQIRGRTRKLVVPRTNPGDLLDPSLALMSRRLGFPDVVELQPFDALELESCRLRALPFLGEHGDLDVHSKLGYRLELDDTAVMFLADSNNLAPRMYEHLRDVYGPASTAFIGLECAGAPVSWAYGPLLFGTVSRSMDQSRRTGGSDAARALKLIEALECRRVYIYAMALEPWMAMFGGAPCDEASIQAREIRTLLAECAARGIHAELLDGSKSLAL